jgi:hypothetical protein
MSFARSTTATGIQKGDKVRLPVAYYFIHAGATGVVKSINGSFATVTMACETRSGGFTHPVGKDWAIPLSNLEKVVEPPKVAAPVVSDLTTLEAALARLEDAAKVGQSLYTVRAAAR